VLVIFFNQQRGAIFRCASADEVFLICTLVRVDQFLDRRAERLVVATLLRDVNLTCFRVERQRRSEYPAYLLPTFGTQLPALSVSC
jgi:hypothetical protein